MDDFDFSLPDCDSTVLEPPGGSAVDPREAAEQAVENPHGPHLAEIVSSDETVAIVVTDVTRATPDDVLLDVLLSELSDAGVPREQITVVIGLGLHRPMTDEEIASALDEHADLAENHDADSAVEIGRVSAGASDVPIELNAVVADADRVLSTGMVEPHQYAGFSGGAKTVAIGAGGESLIRYTHGPDMLSHDGVRLGRIEDNPFRETLDRAGDLLGLDFCLNVTHGPQGVLGASAGHHRDVVADLAEIAKEVLSVPVEGEFDAVVAGVPDAKATNLYQATRAATYVVLGDRNPLRSGGRVVVPAELSEGAGEGRGERRFYDRLAGASDPASLYEELRSGYEPGAQRAFVVARALRDHDVYIAGSDHPTIVEDCLMNARESVADAVDPGSDVLVVPNALETLLV
ncbi:lactate racemase domain-containing protein [Haladaptatus caseinilyticus]|uniref:lactate racemase domain-containing protein n=1 Tax=Haladaptatus caseinilyticus TaxID=2993314 RepID=UPI00224B0F19|nr:lactate racemase domain-containing protein [Haladaptatus caseinilyticus]